MRRLICLLVSGFLGLPAWAQTETTKPGEVLITGIRAGQQLGNQAFLLRLVASPDAPLRIAILPPLALDQVPIPETLTAELLPLLSQLIPQWQWQLGAPPNTEPQAAASAPLEDDSAPGTGSEPIKQPSDSPASSDPRQQKLNTAESQDAQTQDPPLIPFNQQIMRMADLTGLDMALGLRLQSVADGYWVLFSIYSGADGSILLNRKLTLKQLDPNTLAQALKQELDALKQLPPVNDLGPDVGGELHLRSTPPGMHVYFDQVPVGLSPLILRQVPVGAHQLRIFEPEPYQVERIRVVSTPPGLMVTVNDRELGRTPVDFPAELMLPGRFELKLHSEGRDSFEAEIQVQTKPENIPVQLDKLPVQRTPVTFRELDQSSYLLNLMPNQAIDILLPLELPAGQILSQEVDAYKYSKLILNASVLNAEVLLDNEVVGETPYSANLAQGLHTLRLSKNRYRTQEQTVELLPGKTHEIFFNLRPRSADTSIFLTPTGELTPQLNVAAKYLGFGQIQRAESSELGHLYGVEVDYGWPDVFRLGNTFDIGIEVSGFLFALQSPSLLRAFPGVGGKLQFLRESDTIPISAALGSYLSLDWNRPQLVGYISLSRNFGDFALHLGIQTHGFNLNAGYTGWDNLRLGLLIYADSFFRLLTDTDESATTFYGIQAGYSF
ncbi:MAG: hypothetical protein CVV27_05325 [Candidatus Melainabacteria bacterium HGW-Melainabacteria-1]|nr:MAG: hypothetical protein CVV27_05325 [Candidatus Melainabacteria bacterium HGW-Melainabacteria-1]